MTTTETIQPPREVTRDVLLELVRDLLEWEARMGGFEARVWREARELMDEAREADPFADVEFAPTAPSPRAEG